MATVGEKMSKGRKAAHVEETMEEGGECDPGMLLVLKAIMEEQRKNDIAREEARERAEEKREERREEARLRREEESLRRQQEYQKQQEAKQLEQQEMLEKRQAEQQELLEKRAAEKQELLEKRQLEHQRQLVEMQAEVGRKASILHREQANEDKKRDRALFGVPTFREGEDLEEFLVLMEERMIAAGVEKNEWVASVSSKLTGRLAASWREVTAAAPDYEGARIRLLEGSGYTPIAAADRFFGFKFEQCKGLSAGELYQKGVKLVRRIQAPGVMTPEMEFALLKGWVYTVIPKRARASLDARVVTKAAELVAALQDFLTLEGESGAGVTAVFKGRVGEGFRERSSLTCFTCGKVGHRAIDCWQGKGGASAPKEGAAGPKPKIVCFTCGVEGHKSPQCPRNVRMEKGAGKDARPKPIKRIWESHSGCAQIDGVVNGHEAHVLLDSGADISVVPEGMVQPAQLDGRTVAVRPFGATVPMILPVAEIVFKVGELEWSERVAVAPMLEEGQGEVLCRLDIKSKRGLELVMLANEINVKEVARVTTRSKDKAEKQQLEEDRVQVALDQPKVRALVPSGQEVVNEPREEVELKVDGKEVLGDEVEECSRNFGFEFDSLVEEEEEYVLRECSEQKEIDIPPVEKGKHGRKRLVEETKSDPSLAGWRNLAEKSEDGLVWKSGLLFKAVTTHVLDSALVLVLPKSFRRKVLVLAHDNLGHMGARKVKEILKARFSWPGLGKDVIEYCRSCPSCQPCAKRKSRQVPMVERKVYSEPFEVMGVDIVGPFPVGKGGYRFLLTAICMATRWPEAIPLKSVTARAVATALLEVFSRTGIPLQIVSDQGTQFVGKVMTQLCSNLHIDKIKTTPYHPEGNGMVERMHGTLGSMLTKAAKEGHGWVEQIPFALFALRAAPNRDLGFSPFELNYGRKVRTPLDIVHQGWAECEFEELNVEEWAQWLVGKLEVWHDVMREKGEAASKSRKKSFDKKTLVREYEIGDLVLCRIPGMVAKLEESWHGPYSIVGKFNGVDYEVEFARGKRKILHVNNLKRFYEREADVMRLVVVAEDFSSDEAVGLKLQGLCPEFDQAWVEELRSEFCEVFVDVPGRTGVCQLAIRTGDSSPIASVPHRVPDKMKSQVKEEIEKLLELGVIVVSTSPWASPIVPVPKGDGGLRLCIDYRRLNGVTQGDPYYMSTFDEILERVGHSRCISKIDLKKGFYQIEVEEESVEKTAFLSPFGKYEFKRMPFGLKNAPGIFQRAMEIVLRENFDWAAPYIDDIVVFSMTGVQHLAHLKSVFVALRKHGLTVNESKCQFGHQKMDYLGHLIGMGELAIPEHRATAMAKYIQPKTKKQLRAFLGAIGFYRQFVEGFAQWSSLLTPATSKFSPTVVTWEPGMLEAFNSLRVSLCNCCILNVPVEGDVFSLHTDASGRGIGATLNVIREGEERPVAFYSKQLQGAEKFYSATELEGLAVFKSIFRFAHFLWGRHFVVWTDHKALVSMLDSRVLNKRLNGWVLKLLDFDFVVRYKPGRLNCDADGLSRQGWEESEDEHPRTAVVSVGGDVGITPLE